MARNKEKHVVGLNRLWLQALDDENQKKNPPRPGLGSLKTAAEVRKWIPSIKREIDICLKQSQLACYPGSVVEGYTSRVDSLVKEYRAYMRRLQELDAEPNPWTDRPYKRKQKTQEGSAEIFEDGEKNEDKESNVKVRKTENAEFRALNAPILDAADNYPDLYGYNQLNQASLPAPEETQTQDLPLNFRNNDHSKLALTYERRTVALNDQPLVFRSEYFDDTLVARRTQTCSRFDVRARGTADRGNLNDREAIDPSSKKMFNCDRTKQQAKPNRKTNLENENIRFSSETRSCSDFEDFKSYSNIHDAHRKTEKTTKASANISLYIPYSDSSSDDDLE